MNAEHRTIRWCPTCQPDLKLTGRRYAIVKFCVCAHCGGMIMSTVTAHRGPYRSGIELCVGPDRRRSGASLHGDTLDRPDYV